MRRCLAVHAKRSLHCRDGAALYTGLQQWKRPRWKRYGTDNVSLGDRY